MINCRVTHKNPSHDSNTHNITLHNLVDQPEPMKPSVKQKAQTQLAQSMLSSYHTCTPIRNTPSYTNACILRLLSGDTLNNSLASNGIERAHLHYNDVRTLVRSKKWRIMVATQGSKPVHEFPREALNRLNAHRLLTLFNRWYKHAQCVVYLQYP